MRPGRQDDSGLPDAVGILLQVDGAVLPVGKITDQLDVGSVRRAERKNLRPSVAVSCGAVFLSLFFCHSLSFPNNFTGFLQNPIKNQSQPVSTVAGDQS